MSKADCAAFYQYLTINKELRKEALELRKTYQDQEKVMEAFLRLAERENFHFTMQELVEHIYESSSEAGKQGNMRTEHQ